MKEQTSKILCDLVLRMYYSEEDAKKANQVELAQMYAEWREKVTQAIRAEQPATNYKFNIWNFVAKDETRPMMSGVFHEDGFKVASDSHILCWVKESYPVSYEQRTVTKGGEVREGRYPRWRDILPKDNKIAHRVNFDAFDKIVSENKVVKKTGDGKMSEWIKCGNTYFKTEKFKNLVDFMRSFGLTDVMLNENPARACIVGSPDGCGCILMPVRYNDKGDAVLDEVAGIPEV